jgi:hypothetical protein
VLQGQRLSPSDVHQLWTELASNYRMSSRLRTLIVAAVGTSPVVVGVAINIGTPGNGGSIARPPVDNGSPPQESGGTAGPSESPGTEPPAPESGGTEPPEPEQTETAPPMPQPTEPPAPTLPIPEPSEVGQPVQGGGPAPAPETPPQLPVAPEMPAPRAKSTWQTERSLRLVNRSGEALVVYVQLPGEVGPQSYNLGDGEELLVTRDGQPRSATRLRVWARGGGKAWDRYKDDDLVLAPEPYRAETIAEYKLTLNP